MNLNDNIEIFENIIEKRKNIELEEKLYKNINESENNDTQKNRFKDINKELVSLFRLHSSKFHSRKEEKSKDISDRFNEEMNLLVDRRKSLEKINFWEKSFLNKKHSDYKNINEFRKKMAFRFRFMNYSPKKINLKKNFKIKDDKMNKILKISKSIPNYLLKRDNSVRNKNLKKNFDFNIEENNGDYKYNKINNEDADFKRREFGFISPFKLNRYIGNIYNYYRSNNYLNESKLIFNELGNINNSNNDNKEKINNLKNEEKNSFPVKKIFISKDNEKNNIISKKKNVIKLNYLLSKKII